MDNNNFNSTAKLKPLSPSGNPKYHPCTPPNNKSRTKDKKETGPVKVNKY